MADRYFGFTCEPVRGDTNVVLIRTDGGELLCRNSTEFRHQLRRPLRGATGGQIWREQQIRLTRGIVALRRFAPAMCLELLRRGVKPWADPRRRRAA